MLFEVWWNARANMEQCAPEKLTLELHPLILKTDLNKGGFVDYRSGRSPVSSSLSTGLLQDARNAKTGRQTSGRIEVTPMCTVPASNVAFEPIQCLALESDDALLVPLKLSLHHRVLIQSPR